jgi:WD40 repeat protein
LACTFEEAQTSPVAVGTPGYSSPELRAGLPHGPATDVYSLGRVLLELLVGALPEQLGQRPDEVPAELWAIACRACSALEQDRYPDAAGLARDLVAWQAGLPVGAHDYSGLELLQRFVRAWRAPIVVALAASIALGVTGLLGYRATQAERDEARSNLVLALEAQAQAAAAEGKWGPAQELALEALQLAPSPIARGVLARFAGRPGARVLARSATLSCHAVSLSPDGDWELCLGPGGVLRRNLQTGVQDRITDRVFRSGAFIGDPTRVLLGNSDGDLFLSEAGAAPRQVGEMVMGNLAPSQDTRRVCFDGQGPVYCLEGDVLVDRGKLCAPGAPKAIATGPTEVAIACDSGLILLGVDEPRVLARVPEELGSPMSLAWSPSGDRLALGTVRGGVMVFEGDQVLLTRQLWPRTVDQLDIAGDLLAVGQIDGKVEVIDLSTGERIAELDGQRGRLSWTRGERLRLVGAGEEDLLLELPERGRPQRIPVPEGVSGVAVQPGDGRLAVALGSGQVQILDLEDGGLFQELRWQDFVAKDVGFDPSGRSLAVGVVGRPQRVYDTRDWSFVEHAGRTWRRVAWRGQDLWVATYAPGLGRVRLEEPGHADWHEEPVFVELEVSGGELVALDAEARVWRLEGQQLLSLGVHPGAISVAAGPGRVFVGDDAGRVRALDPEGLEVWSLGPGSPVWELAVHDDRLALGRLDGEIELRQAATGDLLAQLSGHEERVPTLAFTGDGDWLVSGSWDRSVRLWWLGDLETSADELLRAR